MKFIAYTSQEGDKWITALSARLKHREGMFYYSRHLPGMRKKMVLVYALVLIRFKYRRESSKY